MEKNFKQATSNDTVYIKEGDSENVSVLITLFLSSGYCSKGVISFVAARGVHTMLNHMRELQTKLTPMPDHSEDLSKVEQIFNELKPYLECSGARLRCLLDIEKKLREDVAEENFAAGFALGWEVRKELQDAGVLSAHEGESSGVFVSSEGK